jgi:L,D-peptidoglycan transpeptidase YkuD (ErfK/YbiS/YcfS/YnhG family)
MPFSRSPKRPPQPVRAPSVWPACQVDCWSLWLNRLAGKATVRASYWALVIGPGDLWSDDPGDEDYNLMVRAPYGQSHEKLRRADPLYDLVILTDWNWPRAVRGHGSAIFIHQWRRPGYPTAGCVGLPRSALKWIAPRIRYGTRLIVL